MPRRRWFRYWKRVLAAVSAVLLTACIWRVCASINFVGEMKIDCYCLDMTTCMVIEHMRANEGAWPNGWDSLDDDFDKLSAYFGNAWTLEELQRRVDVHWRADPQELARNTTTNVSPPFKVIWLRNGQTYHLNEPNQTILNYLRTGKSPLDDGLERHAL